MSSTQSQALDDYVEVPYSADMNPDTFTYEVWAYVTGGSGTWRTVMATRAGYTGMTIYAGTNDNWQFWTGTGSSRAIK